MLDSENLLTFTSKLCSKFKLHTYAKANFYIKSPRC